MIIYWSMLLWIPFIYVFYSSKYREDVALTDYNIRNGIHKKVPKSYAILVFGYVIFWAGMRTYYADTTVYIATYKSLPKDFFSNVSQIDWEGKSPGFDLFSLFFKSFISTDFQVWLMAIAIISGVCVMYMLRKHSVDFFFSAFMFIAMLHFTWMMNGMRQFICVSILFLCSDWIVKGKFVKYLAIVALLSTIHASAWLMLPVYFVVRGTTWSWKTILLVFGMVVFTMYAEPLLGGASNIFGGEAYKNVTDQFSGDDGVNPIRVVFYMIPPILAFWKKAELEKYYEKFPIIPICINMSLITAALYLIGMFTSGIFIGRMPIFCELYNPILVPFIFHAGINETDRKSVRYIYILVLIIYFYLQMDGQYYISELTGIIR